MISKKFSVETRKDRKIPVRVETFSSMGEAMRTISNRPARENYRDVCYLQTERLGGHSPGWLGFDSVDDLRDICTNGLHDTGNVTDVIRFAGKAVVQEKDKLVKKCMDVAGGAVDVPLFLSGSPECMMGLKRKKVRSRIVKTSINCEVLCDISVSEYIEAGKAISKTVASLEKAGYRVRLVANAGIWDYCHGEIAQISVVIKRENEPCNFRRMLMPLMSTAFWRGMTFNWVGTLRGFDPGSGLGQRMDMAFSSDYKEDGLAFINRMALGDGFSRFSINDVIRMNNRNSPEVTEGFLRAKMLELCV